MLYLAEVRGELTEKRHVSVSAGIGEQMEGSQLSVISKTKNHGDCSAPPHPNSETDSGQTKYTVPSWAMATRRGVARLMFVSVGGYIRFSRLSKNRRE